MLKTLFAIAVRHLLGRRRQTLTTIFGVAISTMVLITTNSLTRGLLYCQCSPAYNSQGGKNASNAG